EQAPSQQAMGHQATDLQAPRSKPTGDRWAGAAAAARDDTTRYLCAAAHLSSDYADRAIREFLVEPTRPVPPSPGTDAAAVLNEAVAARARRILRDGALIVLAVPLLFIAPRTPLIVWAVLSVGLLLFKPADRGVRALLPRKYAVVAGAGAVLAVV